MDTINETVASLEAIVSNFEGLRKSDAASFFSHPGKSDRNGANYVAVDKLAHSLTGAAVPIPLICTQVESRLGSRHAAVMGTVPGHLHRLGPVEWPASHRKAEENWRDSEAALLAAHLTPSGESPNGED